MLPRYRLLSLIGFVTCLWLGQTGHAHAGFAVRETTPDAVTRHEPCWRAAWQGLNGRAGADLPLNACEPGTAREENAAGDREFPHAPGTPKQSSPAHSGPISGGATPMGSSAAAGAGADVSPPSLPGRPTHGAAAGERLFLAADRFHSVPPLSGLFRPPRPCP